MANAKSNPEAKSRKTRYIGRNPRALGTNPRARQLTARSWLDANENRIMSERGRDRAWEALVRETQANPAMERGRLNVALKAIREAAFSEGLLEEGIPEEIHLRAEAYRCKWPHLTLTPTALATHWHRVMVKVDSRSSQQRALDSLRVA